MHFDLAHAAISAILILLTVFALKAFGITTRADEARRINWKFALAVFVVMFIFNTIWPL